jgi:hypothetical protein
MHKVSRRSILRRSVGLAGYSRVALAVPQARPPGADRKLRVVSVGGHGDDPQTCAGGTLALFADQGHDVVALSLTGGPPPDADPKVRSVRNRLDDIKAAEILKIRLECLNYSGGNMEQFRYGTACEITPQRYKEFTKLLLDEHKPDIRFHPLADRRSYGSSGCIAAHLHCLAVRWKKVPTRRSWEYKHKTLLPRIMLISLQWNSARTTRGKHCRCGATQCGPS